jgi:hypothetical protein
MPPARTKRAAGSIGLSKRLYLLNAGMHRTQATDAGMEYAPDSGAARQ